MVHLKSKTTVKKLITIAILLLSVGVFAQTGVVQVEADPIVRLTPMTVPFSLEGTIYYDAATNTVKYYNGSAWVAFGAGGASMDVGTAEGQMTYWDHATQTWKPSSETNLKWDAATSILLANQLSVPGTGSHFYDAAASSSIGLVTLSTNGTQQLVLNDLDAGDAQEPFWYLQSANNASKGIFYLGYADRSAGTTMTGATDVMIADASSLTLGSAQGTGTQALYAGAIDGTSLNITGAATFSSTITAKGLTNDGSPDSVLTIAGGVVYRTVSSAISGAADSVFYKVTAYDTVTVGFAAPDETLPVLQLIGDADSDVGDDVTETLTLTLDPDQTPTNSIWEFTSTQGKGYSFDKDLYVENIYTTTGTEMVSVLDYTYKSDNDITIQADRLTFKYQSDVLTGMPAAFDFGYPGTNWELTGTDEQAIMRIKGRVNKASGNYIGILLDALETQAGGSTNELMALRVGGVDKLVVSNTGAVTASTLQTIVGDTVGLGSTATLGMLVFQLDNGTLYCNAGTTTPTWTALH